MSVLAIWGPPQSGKTTVAIDISHALAQHGHSVCLISPESYSEMSARLGIHILREKSLLRALENPGNIKQAVHEVMDLLYVLAVPWDTDAYGEEPNLDSVKGLLAQAVHEYDYIVVDCASNDRSIIASYAMHCASKVLMLSGCSTAACLWYGANRRAVEAVSEKTVCCCLRRIESFDYIGLCKLISLVPEGNLPFYPDIVDVQQRRRTAYGATSRVGKTYTAGLDEVMKRMGIGGAE